MTIDELIKELSNFNPKLEVNLKFDNRMRPINKIQKAILKYTAKGKNDKKTIVVIQ